MGDDLCTTLKRDAKVSVAATNYSVYAYEA